MIEETLKEIGKALQESVKCSNVVILNLQKLNKKELKYLQDVNK